MFYRVIGVVSKRLPAGIEAVFSEFEESRGKWSYQLKAYKKLAYEDDWRQKLEGTPGMPVTDFIRLNTQFGNYIGQFLNTFINDFNLFHQVQLITCIGYPVSDGTELGEGAAIAATTEINTVSNLFLLDGAFGGTGATASAAVGDKLSFEEEGTGEYEEAICTALMGILRWREEYNVPGHLTGASRSSIGGAVWIGQEA